MQEIRVNSSKLIFQKTPWDEKCFGITTEEILDVIYKNETELYQLISLFEKKNQQTTLTYFRCDTNDIIVKKAMLSSHFYITETSVLLTLVKLRKIDFNSLFRNNLTLDSDLHEGELEQIQQIATNNFKYSRFHEDPFIKLEDSKRRYSNWVADLIFKKQKVLVYRQNGEIISFMFYDVIKSSANLLLGGSKDGFGIMSPYFWSAVLTELANNKVKKVTALISAANIVIFNMYLNFGFKVTKTLFDYHKIMNDETLSK